MSARCQSAECRWQTVAFGIFDVTALIHSASSICTRFRAVQLGTEVTVVPSLQRHWRILTDVVSSAVSNSVRSFKAHTDNNIRQDWRHRLQVLDTATSTPLLLLASTKTAVGGLLKAADSTAATTGDGDRQHATATYTEVVCQWLACSARLNELPAALRVVSVAHCGGAQSVKSAI